MKISKLDAAKRELEYAIRLFLTGGDPVVLHVVAFSANQVLGDLCKHYKLPHMMDDLSKWVVPDKLNFVKNLVKKDYNFFHHADLDPDGLMEFNPEITEIIIWEAVLSYQSLAKEISGVMRAYRTWFYMKNPNALVEWEDKENYRQLAKDIGIENKGEMLKLGEMMEQERLGKKKMVS